MFYIVFFSEIKSEAKTSVRDEKGGKKVKVKGGEGVGGGWKRNWVGGKVREKAGWKIV